MPDSMMYQEDYFVVLESDKPEVFLTPEELLEKLKVILQEKPEEEIPAQIKKFSSIEQRATHLRDNYCDLDVGEGNYLQWYVVRLEK
ncbi:MAG: chlororespiratory reduction protein 7 [Prochloraceae cyanobacterium]